jgi:hypothetical protein
MKFFAGRYLQSPGQVVSCSPFAALAPPLAAGRRGASSAAKSRGIAAGL